MNTTTTFPVDSEHGALRSSILFSFIAIWIITYAILNRLITSEGLNLIAILAGFGIAALGTSRLIEPLLKKRWPSGRTVQIDETGARLLKKDRVEVEIKAGEPVDVLRWQFEIKRGRNRVPKGWHVMACALEQDDQYLPVYVLASPDDAKKLHDVVRFSSLLTEKETKTRGNSLQLAGEQRRLRIAESHRWTEGAEMAVPDFERFLVWVSEQFPR